MPVQCLPEHKNLRKPCSASEDGMIARSYRWGIKVAIGLLATITVLEGKNAEFENAFLDLTEKVRENEPGNIFYALHKSAQDPQVYKVMEQYDSHEALELHSKTEYFRHANKQLAGLVASAPDIEVLEAVTR